MSSSFLAGLSLPYDPRWWYGEPMGALVVDPAVLRRRQVPWSVLQEALAQPDSGDPVADGEVPVAGELESHARILDHYVRLKRLQWEARRSALAGGGGPAALLLRVQAPRVNNGCVAAVLAAAQVRADAATGAEPRGVPAVALRAGPAGRAALRMVGDLLDVGNPHHPERWSLELVRDILVDIVSVWQVPPDPTPTGGGENRGPPPGRPPPATAGGDGGGGGRRREAPTGLPPPPKRPQTMPGPARGERPPAPDPHQEASSSRAFRPATAPVRPAAGATGRAQPPGAPPRPPPTAAAKGGRSPPPSEPPAQRQSSVNAAGRGRIPSGLADQPAPPSQQRGHTPVVAMAEGVPAPAGALPTSHTGQPPEASSTAGIPPPSAHPPRPGEAAGAAATTGTAPGPSLQAASVGTPGGNGPAAATVPHASPPPTSPSAAAPTRPGTSASGHTGGDPPPPQPPRGDETMADAGPRSDERRDPRADGTLEAGRVPPPPGAAGQGSWRERVDRWASGEQRGQHGPLQEALRGMPRPGENEDCLTKWAWELVQPPPPTNDDDADRQKGLHAIPVCVKAVDDAMAGRLQRGIQDAVLLAAELPDSQALVEADAHTARRVCCVLQRLQQAMETGGPLAAWAEDANAMWLMMVLRQWCHQTASGSPTGEADQRAAAALKKAVLDNWGRDPEDMRMPGSPQATPTPDPDPAPMQGPPQGASSRDGTSHPPPNGSARRPEDPTDDDGAPGPPDGSTPQNRATAPPPSGTPAAVTGPGGAPPLTPPNEPAGAGGSARPTGPAGGRRESGDRRPSGAMESSTAARGNADGIGTGTDGRSSTQPGAPEEADPGPSRHRPSLSTVQDLRGLRAVTVAEADHDEDGEQTPGTHPPGRDPAPDGTAAPPSDTPPGGQEDTGRHPEPPGDRQGQAGHVGADGRGAPDGPQGRGPSAAGRAWPDSPPPPGGAPTSPEPGRRVLDTSGGEGGALFTRASSASSSRSREQTMKLESASSDPGVVTDGHLPMVVDDGGRPASGVGATPPASGEAPETPSSGSEAAVAAAAPVYPTRSPAPAAARTPPHGPGDDPPAPSSSPEVVPVRRTGTPSERAATPSASTTAAGTPSTIGRVDSGGDLVFPDPVTVQPWQADEEGTSAPPDGGVDLLPGAAVVARGAVHRPALPQRGATTTPDGLGLETSVNLSNISSATPSLRRTDQQFFMKFLLQEMPDRDMLRTHDKRYQMMVASLQSAVDAWCTTGDTMLNELRRHSPSEEGMGMDADCAHVVFPVASWVLLKILQVVRLPDTLRDSWDCIRRTTEEHVSILRGIVQSDPPSKWSSPFQLVLQRMPEVVRDSVFGRGILSRSPPALSALRASAGENDRAAGMSGTPDSTTSRQSQSSCGITADSVGLALASILRRVTHLVLLPALQREELDTLLADEVARDAIVGGVNYGYSRRSITQLGAQFMHMVGAWQGSWSNWWELSDGTPGGLLDLGRMHWVCIISWILEQLAGLVYPGMGEKMNRLKAERQRLSAALTAHSGVGTADRGGGGGPAGAPPETRQGTPENDRTGLVRTLLLATPETIRENVFGTELGRLVPSPTGERAAPAAPSEWYKTSTLPLSHFVPVVHQMAISYRETMKDHHGFQERIMNALYCCMEHYHHAPGDLAVEVVAILHQAV